MVSDDTAPQYPRSALITIDVQRDFLDGQPFEIRGTSAAVPAMGRLVRFFRLKARPIVHMVRLYRADGSNVEPCRRHMVEQGAQLVLLGSVGSQLAAPLLTTPETTLDAEFYGGKEVGPVSRLAIGRDNERGALVLHCSRTWNVLGIARHAGIKEAKRRAERIYPGLSAKWLKTGVSKRQAKAYLDKALKGVECSFCGKRPDQIDQMVSTGNARICNVCVRDIAAMMSIE